MEFKLANGTTIVNTEFHSYNISDLSEIELATIGRYCFYLLRTQNQSHLENVAKEMLRSISTEKIFRANKNANQIAETAQQVIKANNESDTRWAKRAFFAVLTVGLLQVVAAVCAAILTRR